MEQENVTYRMAQTLKRLHHDGLFLELDPPDGSWEAYIEQSLKLRPRQVAKWMVVAGNFTETNAGIYGVEKLYLLAQYFIAKAQAIPVALDRFEIEDEDGTRWRFADLTVAQCEKFFRVGDAGREGGVSEEEVAFAKLICTVLPELAGELIVEVKPGQDGTQLVLKLRRLERLPELVGLLSKRMAELTLPASRSARAAKKAAKKAAMNAAESKKKSEPAPTEAPMLEAKPEARVLAGVTEKPATTVAQTRTEAPVRRNGPAKITAPRQISEAVESVAPPAPLGEAADRMARTSLHVPVPIEQRLPWTAPILNAVRSKRDETATKVREGLKNATKVREGLKTALDQLRELNFPLPKKI